MGGEMGIRKSGGMRNQNQDTLREGEKKLFSIKGKNKNILKGFVIHTNFPNLAYPLRQELSMFFFYYEMKMAIVLDVNKLMKII